MDKIVWLLEHYDWELEEILYNNNISKEDVLYALNELGMIDVEELYIVSKHYGINGDDDEEA
jgi:hypothetical protein